MCGCGCGHTTDALQVRGGARVSFPAQEQVPQEVKARAFAGTSSCPSLLGSLPPRPPSLWLWLCTTRSTGECDSADARAFEGSQHIPATKTFVQLRVLNSVPSIQIPISYACNRQRRQSTAVGTPLVVCQAWQSCVASSCAPGCTRACAK